MGMFSHLVLHRPYGWSEKAPELTGEDAGLLMEMERQNIEAKRREDLIRQCAERLLSGDRDWVDPIRYKPHEYARGIEHAAIAEAFKTLKGRE